MLCCFLNTINGLLTLLGLSTIGASWLGATNSYFFIILMVINGITISYFIYQGWKDSKKRFIVGFMCLGFMLTNLNYIYKIYHNKSFCKGCINKNEGCCHLDCGHKKQSCHHNSKNHHNINNYHNWNNLLTLISFLGIIINLLSFFFYHRRFHKKNEDFCCNSSCNHDS